MTVRKNFHFDEEVAKHLEEIAKERGQTQTQAVQEAIEKEYKKISIKKKLEILDEIKDSFHGLLTDVDIKDVRKQRALRRYDK